MIANEINEKEKSQRELVFTEESRTSILMDEEESKGMNSLRKEKKKGWYFFLKWFLFVLILF